MLGIEWIATAGTRANLAVGAVVVAVWLLRGAVIAILSKSDRRRL